MLHATARRAFFLFAFLAACSGDDDAPGGTCAAGGICANGRDYDALSYALSGQFDWQAGRLTAKEQISLQLKTAGTRVVELDSAVQVKRVYAGATALPYTTDALLRVLRVDLSPLSPGTAPVSFTVEYEAGTSSALYAATGRDADPVTSRVLFTDSEPFDGMLWLVANHRPFDRAEWSVELNVPPDEDVIANGVRERDEVVDGRRFVRYAMAEPLPTYLMAFAAGQLEHRERGDGRVPLSVWYRRGLLLEPADTLDRVADAMATFENLLGPYPWSSYSVVLLPEFSGGMENATITFNAESSGQANPNFGLNAHELAHQWFGDWVTVRDFDDVWVKEGMATLLQVEADRARRDAAKKGRLFGYAFPFTPTDAVRDRQLRGIEKYTTGPYTRAAWLLTQIRAVVGEESFWQSLRDVLRDHALDSVDSEAFVRAFALDEGTRQKVLAALDQKQVPAVTIASEPEAAGARITLTITDPGGTLIAPLKVTVVEAGGAAATSTLAPGTPLSLLVPEGGYIAPDEEDVHPDWSSSFSVSLSDYSEKLAPLFVPSGLGAVAELGARSSAHQERALAYGSSFPVASIAFKSVYASLDSLVAQRSAETRGCWALGVQPSEDWGTVLSPILSTPALTTWSSGYALCGPAFARGLLGPELPGVAANVDAASASRLVYLSSYDYGAPTSLEIFSRVATDAPSLQLREQAIARLSVQADPAGGYTPISPLDVDAWKTFFRDRLRETTSATRLRMVWRGVVGLADDAALATVGQKLHQIQLPADLQRQVVCDAYRMTGFGQASAWTDFGEAAQPWTTLAPVAAAALQMPGICTR